MTAPAEEGKVPQTTAEGAITEASPTAATEPSVPNPRAGSPSDSQPADSQPAQSQPAQSQGPPASPVALSLPAWLKNVAAAVGALGLAVVGALSSLSIVHWTTTQTTLVTAEFGAVLALAVALVAHFWPATAKEPVALAATFTAVFSATAALLVGFGWWHITAQQTATVVSVFTGVVGVVGALFARTQVTANQSQSS